MALPVFVPRDYQRALRDFARDNRRVQWWAGTGVGKTGTGLDLYDYLRMFGEVRHLLVLATHRIATLVWPREIKKWRNFEHLSLSVAVGTAAERIAALKRKSNITVINYENIPWLMKVAGDEWYWDMVIPDESTRLKSLRVDTRTSVLGKDFQRKSGGSVRAAALMPVVHKRVRYWVNMTGTPSPNGLIDQWGQMWFIDGGRRLGRSFTGYADRWFRWVQVGNDIYSKKLELMPYSQDQIERLLAEVSMTIEAKDYMDLPPTVINRIPVRMPDSARDAYREMERQLFTALRRGEIDFEVEAVNSGAKSMKCRQLASGAIYVDDKSNWIETHRAKLDVLLDTVNELNGAPLLVAYYFKFDLDRIKQAIPQAVEMDGKPATLQRFIDGEIPVLLMHPKSDAHGIDGMQESCNNIFWFVPIWELEEFQQLCDRIGATRQAQSGRNKTVYVHLPYIEDTVEYEMLERIDTKASMQESLMLAAKRRAKQ